MVLSQLTKRLKEYPDFLSLNRGDYVAVKNGNDGLCGIGVITGDYYFKLNGHNTCSSSPDDFYSHFFPVKWLITTYMRRKNLLRPGEKSWPYGIISLLPDIPVYARRVLAKHEIKLNG